MRYLYTILFWLILPFIFIRLLWKSLRQPAYRHRMPERLGWGLPSFKSCLWVHAVSVGESIAAIPLIKLLHAHFPSLPLVVTTMTPTGAERIKSALGDTVTHVYVPYDLPGPMHRFLRKINPVACVIMETELWPNLIATCHQNGVPVCLVNARLSAKSAAGYQKIAGLTRSMLQNLAFIAAHGHADAERFIALGAKPENVTVTGSIKFDLTLPDELAANMMTLKNNLGNRIAWIAASTHEGEEEMLLGAHERIRQQMPDVLLILVPRHPDRFDAVAKLCEQKFVTVRRSTHAPAPAETAVYLGDTMGELLLLYGIANIAFVGGSLVPRGGHNMLEPAALGKPILTGEHLFNFAEISQLLLAKNAMLKVRDADALAEKIIWLLQDDKASKAMGQLALKVMHDNRGALAKQMQMVCDVVEANF